MKFKPTNKINNIITLFIFVTIIICSMYIVFWINKNLDIKEGFTPKINRFVNSSVRQSRQYIFPPLLEYLNYGFTKITRYIRNN